MIEGENQMERNYQKEYALAMKKIAELQELVFAYQSMLDDVVSKDTEDSTEALQTKIKGEDE